MVMQKTYNRVSPQKQLKPKSLITSISDIKCGVKTLRVAPTRFSFTYTFSYRRAKASLQLVTFLNLAQSKQLAIINSKIVRFQGPYKVPVLSVQLNKNHHKLAKSKSLLSVPRTPDLLATALTTCHRKEIKSYLVVWKFSKANYSTSEIKHETQITT